MATSWHHMGVICASQAQLLLCCVAHGNLCCCYSCGTCEAAAQMSEDPAIVCYKKGCARSLWKGTEGEQGH